MSASTTVACVSASVTETWIVSHTVSPVRAYSTVFLMRIPTSWSLRAISAMALRTDVSCRALRTLSNVDGVAGIPIFDLDSSNGDWPQHELVTGPMSDPPAICTLAFSTMEACISLPFLVKRSMAYCIVELVAVSTPLGELGQKVISLRPWRSREVFIIIQRQQTVCVV